MNVPFPPVLLWPVVIGMVVGALSWRRWQKRATAAGPSEELSKNAPKGWRLFGLFPWMLAIVGVVGAYSLWRFSAPSLYGVVLDGATGQGIPNALVARKVFRSAQVSLTESPGIFTELWSRVETRTDPRGRFRLPGYISLLPLGIQGESGMAWNVFASGYMIAGGCEFKGFKSGDGCGAEGGFSYPDAWATTSVKRRFGRIGLEVRLRALPATDGNAWGEYFRRLNLLVQYRYIKKDELVQQAVGYARRSSPLNDEIAVQFLELVGAPILERPIPHDRDPQVLFLRKAIVNYCDQAPESDFCRRYAVGLGYIRQYFLQKDFGAR
jgi:hypothetical protein